MVEWEKCGEVKIKLNFSYNFLFTGNLRKKGGEKNPEVILEQ